MPRAITHCPNCGQVVLGTGPIGLLVVCYFAWQMNEEGRILQRNLMLGLAVLGMLPFVFGLSLWSLLAG